MSKHRERPPLHLKPVPSRRLAWFVLLTHAAAGAAVVPLPLPWSGRAGLLLLLALDLGFQAGTHLTRRLPWAIREAVWESQGSWTLTLGSGRQVEGRLLPTSFVSTRLVVLNFRRDRWRPCSLVLTEDSLDPDLLRRLRAGLRLGGASATGTSDATA